MNELGPWILLATLVAAVASIVMTALVTRGKSGRETLDIVQGENERLQRELNDARAGWKNCETELARKNTQISDLLTERWQRQRNPRGEER